MLFGIFSFIKRFKISIIFLFALACALALLLYLSSGDTLLKGIKIEDTDVSKLSVSDAKAVLIGSISQKYSDNRLLFKYGDRVWDFGLENISYRFMVDEALKRAYNLSKSGDIFERAFKRVKLAVNGQSLKIGVSYDRDMLTEILKKIKSEIDTGEKNAEITYIKNKISFKQEVVGKRLDVDNNLQLIENQLIHRNFENLELNVDDVTPAIRYEDIKDINGTISNFSTSFNKADVNRSDNIRLACSRLNGRILMPGEEFSMNDTLGSRTVENGYKEAPVILKNELVTGTGGGICQVRPRFMTQYFSQGSM
jgi:hypothetical protein